jgi:sugar/nucleoside kinase (ribokinase family)
LDQVREERFDEDFDIFVTEYGNRASDYISKFAKYLCYNGQMPFIKWEYEKEMAFIAKSEILFLSEIYLKNLFGIDSIKKEHIMQFSNIPLVVLGRGEKGIIALYQNEYISLPAKSVKVIDTTGAGDIFFGNLIHKYFSRSQKNVTQIKKILMESIIHASNSCSYIGARRYILEERG